MLIYYSVTDYSKIEGFKAVIRISELSFSGLGVWGGSAGCCWLAVSHQGAVSCQSRLQTVAFEDLQIGLLPRWFPRWFPRGWKLVLAVGRRSQILPSLWPLHRDAECPHNMAASLPSVSDPRERAVRSSMYLVRPGLGSHTSHVCSILTVPFLQRLSSVGVGVEGQWKHYIEAGAENHRQPQGAPTKCPHLCWCLYIPFSSRQLCEAIICPCFQKGKRDESAS